jgi:hypothetical protein
MELATTLIWRERPAQLRDEPVSRASTQPVRIKEGSTAGRVQTTPTSTFRGHVVSNRSCDQRADGKILETFNYFALSNIL